MIIRHHRYLCFYEKISSAASTSIAPPPFSTAHFRRVCRLIFHEFINSEQYTMYNNQQLLIYRQWFLGVSLIISKVGFDCEYFSACIPSQIKMMVKIFKFLKWILTINLKATINKIFIIHFMSSYRILNLNRLQYLSAMQSDLKGGGDTGKE